MTETVPPGTERASASTDTGIRRPWLVFSLLVATAALTILDVSKVGIVLPVIQKSLGSSPSIIQFMLTGYTIAYALLLLPFGRLGDILPRTKVFIAGAALFIAASVICAVAPTDVWIVAGRIAQGTGAGILMPQVLGIIQRIFPPAQRAKPLAILAGVVSITSTFGPVLAGLIMQVAPGADSWRLLFWVNVAAGAIILPLAVVFVREPAGHRKRGFDGTGTALLIPAVILLIAPLSMVSAENSFAPWMAASMVVGAVAAGAFVWHERARARRGAEALVDPALFSFRNFPSGVLIAGFMHAAATASTLVVTLYYQERAGQGVLMTALWMLPAALTMIAGSLIAGRQGVERSYRLIVTGTAVAAAGLFVIAGIMAILPPEQAMIGICGTLLVSSFGIALVGPPNQARALTRVPDFRSSIAGSTIQFAQRIGSAIGMALALLVFYPMLGTPTFAGQPAAGPALAVLLTAAFVACACGVAISDRNPRPPQTPSA